MPGLYTRQLSDLPVDWGSILGMLKSRGAEPFQRAHPMGLKIVRRWSYSGTSRHLPTFFFATKPNTTNRSAGVSFNLPWWVYISRRHDLPTFFFFAVKPNAARKIFICVYISRRR